ncbi:MAG TPA: CPBP family intramembrane glutamic endopeptidase, partial [Bacilli bacterium]|nr:CPBP family intramembrane glutamic endopeptidase [Bacilli bacterium]
RGRSDGMARRTNRLLWIFGLIGFVLFIGFAIQDPSLRSEGELNREQVLDKAVAFWQEQGVDVSDLEPKATVETEQNADGYVGKYDLRDELAKKMPTDAALIYWQVVYADRETGATYQVRIHPETGKVVGYERDEAFDGNAFDRVQAEQVAVSELKKRGIDPSKLLREKWMEEDLADNPVETLSTFRDEGRWTFMYRVEDWELRTMKYRYLVTVSGDQVSAVNTQFLVPRDFLQWHDRQQTIGMLLTGLSLLLSFVLFVLALLFLFLLKQKKPFWSSLWLSLLVFVLFAFSNLEQLPLLQQQLLTAGGEIGVTLGTTIVVVVVLIMALLIGAATYPMLLTGGMLVRLVKPSLWLSWRDMEWPERMRGAVWKGYLLAFAWLGFQGVFYWIAEEYFGVWYESDTSMSPVNAWVPLLFPLLAWLAGIQEEVTYRLFGVTFFKKYFKSSLVAVLIPAMIWALGHSLYPIYPIYTRFIELTIFGGVIGYCYLWLGIEAVILAHVIFDTIQMCIPMLLSGEIVQIVSGVLFLLLPIAVGYGLSLVRPRRKLEPESFEIV